MQDYASLYAQSVDDVESFWLDAHKIFLGIHRLKPALIAVMRHFTAGFLMAA